MALTLARSLLNEVTTSLNLAHHGIGAVLISKTLGASFTRAAIEELLQHELAEIVTPARELALQAARRQKPMVMA
jgi:hypothetical protein